MAFFFFLILFYFFLFISKPMFRQNFLPVTSSNGLSFIIPPISSWIFLSVSYNSIYIFFFFMWNSSFTHSINTFSPFFLQSSILLFRYSMFNFHENINISMFIFTFLYLSNLCASFHLIKEYHFCCLNSAFGQFYYFFFVTTQVSLPYSWVRIAMTTLNFNFIHL